MSDGVNERKNRGMCAWKKVRECRHGTKECEEKERMSESWRK